MPCSIWVSAICRHWPILRTCLASTLTKRITTEGITSAFSGSRGAIRRTSFRNRRHEREPGPEVQQIDLVSKYTFGWMLRSVDQTATSVATPK